MKTNTLKKIYMFIIALALISTTATAWSTTYYVSNTNGNDSNSGKSSTTSWKTIQKFANVANPGDTVTVSAGTYNERVMVKRSGAIGNPVSFVASGSVITKGFSVMANYITINGFEITDTASNTASDYEAWRDNNGMYVNGVNCNIINNYIHDVALIGIYVHEPSTTSVTTGYCTIKGNQIVRATLNGISIEGSNLTIESNDISGTLKNDQTDADGITFFGSGHMFVGNRIHDIYLKDPTNATCHIDCFQTWGPAHDITFDKNSCENLNDGMQGFMIEVKNNNPVYNIIVKNNIINAFRIMNIWDSPQISILNNTFISSLNYTKESAYGVELHNSPSSKILNNIFIDIGKHSYNYIYAEDSSKSSLSIGTNCIFMTDGMLPLGPSYTNDLWQIDPKLRNIVGGDFHPVLGSPIIDKGISLSEIDSDFYGTSRPQYNGIDIGAIEFKLVFPEMEDTKLTIIPLGK
jgi:hypothetical protein